MEGIESHVYYSLTIGGKEIAFITDAVIVTWIIMAAIIAAVLILTKKLERVPGNGQNAAESIVEFIDGMCSANIGHHWRVFAPYIATVLLYLAISNMAGLFNILPQGEFLAKVFHNPALESFKLPIHPPTKNFNVTLAIALMTMVVAFFSEFRYKGIGGWGRSFYRPSPINGVVKLMDYVIRPTSLSLRLFGNVMGGFIVIELLYAALPPVVPAAVGVYFDLFDGALQAYVFAFLTMVYIGESVEVEEAA